MNNIEWKAVKGYEGLYEVSNMGDVRSINRIVVDKNGRTKNLKGKELFFTISKVDKHGHLPRASVQLWKNNTCVLKHIHRIVAETFIPNPENKPTVNHIDGNPLNNCVDNLEWATYSENQIHAYKTGLTSVSRNYFPSNSKKVLAYNPSTEEEIIMDSASQLARYLGVCHQFVSKCAVSTNINERCKGFIVRYL